MTGPTAWTTLQLTVGLDGTSEVELVGGSPFPRHWVYGEDGSLMAKSGLIDFADWTHHQEGEGTPWHDYDRKVLMSDVESQVERSLSSTVMDGKPDLIRLDHDEILIEQGQAGGSIYLILDGMLLVEVDGDGVAELGPGAIVGERAVLEGGLATATVRTVTQVRAARIPASGLDSMSLERLAAGHHRETG